MTLYCMKLAVKKIQWYFVCLILCLQPCFADLITIRGKSIIDKPVKYKHVTLDVKNGYFQLEKNGALTIEDSLIFGTISPHQPFMINTLSGNLSLRNNTVLITVRDIAPSPAQLTIYKVINFLQGQLTMTGNRFKIDKPYTVALLATQSKPTANFIIDNNNIQGFHGGIFLSNSNNAFVTHNRFSNVSISNIFTLNGQNNVFAKNVILFSGNNSVGNSVDIIDSNQIKLIDNDISSGSCYSVVILRSQNVLIDHNRITGGITYAIYITSSIGTDDPYNHYLLKMITRYPKAASYQNRDIVITNNYLSQNRFGLTASNVDGLIVKNNVFIQKFPDKKQRKFWTDNDTLIKDTVRLVWEDNLYKEAYSQLMHDTNDIAKQFVAFPAHAGVAL